MKRIILQWHIINVDVVLEYKYNAEYKTLQQEKHFYLLLIHLNRLFVN